MRFLSPNYGLFGRTCRHMRHVSVSKLNQERKRCTNWRRRTRNLVHPKEMNEDKLKIKTNNERDFEIPQEDVSAGADRHFSVSQCTVTSLALIAKLKRHQRIDVAFWNRSSCTFLQPGPTNYGHSFISSWSGHCSHISKGAFCLVKCISVNLIDLVCRAKCQQFAQFVNRVRLQIGLSIFFRIASIELHSICGQSVVDLVNFHSVFRLPFVHRTRSRPHQHCVGCGRSRPN